MNLLSEVAKLKEQLGLNDISISFNGNTDGMMVIGITIRVNEKMHAKITKELSWQCGDIGVISAINEMNSQMQAMIRGLKK